MKNQCACGFETAEGTTHCLYCWAGGYYEPKTARCASCKAAISVQQVVWTPVDAELQIELHRAGIDLLHNGYNVRAGADHSGLEHVWLTTTAYGIRVARCLYCARRSPYAAPNPGRSLDDRIAVAKLSAPKVVEPEPKGWVAWSSPHDEGP